LRRINAEVSRGDQINLHQQEPPVECKRRTPRLESALCACLGPRAGL